VTLDPDPAGGRGNRFESREGPKFILRVESPLEIAPRADFLGKRRRVGDRGSRGGEGTAGRGRIAKMRGKSLP